MSSDEPWLFSRGTPNPYLFGIGIRRSSGSEPAPERIAAAATILGRPVRYTDGDGYQHEIVAAALNPESRTLAYVESRAKQLKEYVDIHFHLRLRNDEEREVAWEVESYNPYFGCDVRFMEWYGETVLVVYREKHDTYVCRFGLDFPAVCKRIEDDWVLNGPQLGYWGYKETVVRRLSIPALEELPAISQEEAADSNLLPTKYW